MFFKAYKYRIYPTDTQKVLLEKHFGCARFIYNLALETKEMAFRGQRVNLTGFDLIKQITELKKDLTWLSEVSISSLQQSVIHLDGAYKKYLNGISEYPKFKKKANSATFKCIEGVKIVNGLLSVSKFREGIKVIETQKTPQKIKSATISKTPTGKYFVSLLLEFEQLPLPKNNKSVGIDLGLKTFAVLSDGKEYAAPKFLRKSLDRLKFLQRRASKKKKWSANRKKANLKVALLHEHIVNQRNDFLHKASNEITNQNGTICIEDLNVQGMIKNHNLALSINDAGWSEFTRQLAYKSQWRGRQLIAIGRFEPTSKQCSSCGEIKNMPLIERTYNCACGLSIDRDINAAINIRNLGMLSTGAPVE